jgi:hypothetical protein
MFFAIVAPADQIGFVGLETMQGELVFFGVDRNGPDAKFGRGAEDPDGNFRPVGDEESFERLRHEGSVCDRGTRAALIVIMEAYKTYAQCLQRMAFVISQL